MNYENFLLALKKNPVIGVLRAPTKELALEAITACCNVGFDQIEITFSTPDAVRVLDEARHKFPQAFLGVGTILVPEQIAAAHDYGAKFFVSPHADAHLIETALEKKLCYIPGGNTPTELMQILGFGCQVQKLFPANVHGPSGVKGVLAALPMLNMIVTGGVNEKTAKDYLQSGAKGICVGNNLFTDEIWKNKDWKSLEKAAKAWLTL